MKRFERHMTQRSDEAVAREAARCREQGVSEFSGGTFTHPTHGTCQGVFDGETTEFVWANFKPWCERVHRGVAEALRKEGRRVESQVMRIPNYPTVYFTRLLE